MLSKRFVFLIGSIFFMVAIRQAEALPAVVGEFQIIALSGDEAPDTGGRRFLQFGVPDLNDVGQVSFGATLECCSPRSAVFSNGTGDLRLVAMEQSTVQPDSEVSFRSFNNVQIDNLGRTWIRADMNGLPHDFDGISVGQHNNMLSLAVASGQSVSPQEPNLRYRTIGTGNLSGAGVMVGAATASMDGSSRGSYGVIYRLSGTQPAELLLKEGVQLNSVIPGIDDEIVIGSFGSPVVNDLGQLALLVYTFNSSSPRYESHGQFLVVVDENRNYRSVARIEKPLSTLLPGERQFFSDPLSRPIINQHGTVAFTSNDFRGEIWRKRIDSEMEQIAVAGDEIPGLPGAFFDLFFSTTPIGEQDSLWVTNQDEVVFTSTIAGGSFDELAESIWIGKPGELRPILIEGDEAPGTGSFFSSELSTVGDLIHQMTVNGNGQVALSASFETSTGRRFGVFATDAQGELKKIAAYGDLIEVAPGDLREVDSVTLAGNSQQRWGTGMNKQGQIAFHASFRDGSAGIFLSNLVAVPEPATILAVASMLVFHSFCWRRVNY